MSEKKIVETALYKNYIFDLDGTLTDSSYAIGIGVVESLKLLDIHDVKVEDINPWIGRPLVEIWDAYIAERNLDIVVENGLFDSLLTAYRKGHDENFPSGVTIYEGVHELLARLRKSGAKIAVATTKFEEAADFVMRGINLDSYVDSICGTDPGNPVKPDPFVINLALERLSANPSETLVVGDTPADVLAAHAAGCDAAAVTYGFGDRKKLEASKPEFWIDRPEDLP